PVCFSVCWQIAWLGTNRVDSNQLDTHSTNNSRHCLDWAAHLPDLQTLEIRLSLRTHPPDGAQHRHRPLELHCAGNTSPVPHRPIPLGVLVRKGYREIQTGGKIKGAASAKRPILRAAKRQPAVLSQKLGASS